MSPEGEEVMLCQTHGKEYQVSQPLCLQESQVEEMGQDDVKEEIKEELCEDFEFESQGNMKI